jgi:hypothetical protein
VRSFKVRFPPTPTLKMRKPAGSFALAARTIVASFPLIEMGWTRVSAKT